MSGPFVREMRTSPASRFTRPAVRRRLAAGVIASLVASGLVVTPGAATRVLAADPPEYHAFPIGQLEGVSAINVINDAGVMGGLTKTSTLTRIDGHTATPITPIGQGSLFGISAAGTMVGQVGQKAVRVDGTTATDLPGLGGQYESASDIDGSGTRIVGVSVEPGVSETAWLDEGGTTTPLPGIGGDYSYTAPNRVNDSGLIAGTAFNPDTGDSTFVTWQDGVVTDLGRFGGVSGSISDLNAAGHILAGVNLAGGASRAVFWDGVSPVELGDLGGSPTYATDMNDADQIAVTSTDPDGHSHALVWEDGSFDDLGTLGGSDANAQAINDHGQVIGNSLTAGGRWHGYVVDHGVMYDLNDLLPAHSVEIQFTEKITNSGDIVADAESGPVLLVPGPTPPAAYDVIDLGTSALGTESNVGATDMNAARQVIGQYGFGAYRYDGTTSSLLFGPFEGGVRAINEGGTIVGGAQHNGQAEAYRFDGTIHFLGTLGGQSFASDINDTGDIVGTAADGSNVNHAFLYRDGTFAPLTVPGATGSEAVRINAGGTIIGYDWTGSYNGQLAKAFMSDGTTATDLGTLGGTWTIPAAINDAGEIVGQSRTASKDSVAFWYHGGSMQPIDPAGSTESWAVDINSSGQILGSERDTGGNDHPFVYDHGTLTPIPGLGGAASGATDLNDRGQVVGAAFTPNSGHAFLYEAGHTADLNDLIPLGYEGVIGYAAKINEDGTILAVAGGTHTRQWAVLLVPTAPVPPPPVHATPAHPTVASVDSPVAGSVTVTEAATNDPPPVGSGYTFLGHQLNITAPTASTANPISIVFNVDASLLTSVDPDLTADDVAVFRDGAPIAACTPIGTDDPATPDPCVSLRETLSGGEDAGDSRITVLTQAASHWNVGVAPTPPGPPTGVIAVRGDKRATVSWTAPATTGHSSITGYTVTSAPGGKSATVAGSASSAIVTGLTNGTTYTFTVVATNAVGPGPASASSNAVTPGMLQNQTITFAKPANQVLTTPSITVTATTSSGLPVTLTSTSPSICTASGFDISLLAAGTCAITASQAGDGTYNPASPVSRTFSISQATQVITFAKPAPQLLTTPTLTVNPTSDRGLPVTVTSTTQAVCTVSGFDVSLLGVGTCSLTASQPGDPVYRAATPVTRTFAISQATQTITFAKPAAQVLTTSSITVAPTASSGLPVTLTSTSSSICTVSGFTINLLAAGTCAVTASQAGDVAYKAAASVARTFAISKAPQTITIPDPGPRSLGTHTAVLSPSASSGLAVTLSSQTTSICTVSGNTVSLLKVGVCKIKGTQAGNAVYDPAPAIVRQFNVTA